ncbi:hypothetical protein ACFWVU_02360 [Streptomyces sp. NPDC058686]|uniref:hypothetical protein n=1 Tax=Streptomyces sp. NPDC058686 TaxID=3346599 RepID=UPI00364FADD3
MSQATKRTIRTVLQSAVALAVALPAIVDSAGHADAAPCAAGAVAATGAFARIMALPTVEQILDRVGLGLVTDKGGSA